MVITELSHSGKTAKKKNVRVVWKKFVLLAVLTLDHILYIAYARYARSSPIHCIFFFFFPLENMGMFTLTD